MKKRTLYLMVVLLLTSLLLSGCFSVTQEMWVNTDGSAKISIDMGMSKSLLDMAGSGSDPLAEFSNQFEGSGLYKDVTTRTYEEGDLKHIVVEFSVDSFEQYIANPGGSTDQSLNTDISLTKLDNGNFKLVQTVAGTGGGLDTMDADTQKMMESMFKDKYWTTRIHVPSVVSTNGTNNGNVAEWKVPMSDMMLKNQPIEMSLEYSLTPGTPGWLLPVIIIAVVLIILAVVLFVLLRRRKAAPAPVAAAVQAPQYPPQGQYPQYPPQGQYPQYPQYPQPPVPPAPSTVEPPAGNPPENLPPAS